MLLDIAPAVFIAGDHHEIHALIRMDIKDRHPWRLTMVAAMAFDEFARVNLPNTPEARELAEKQFVAAADHSARGQVVTLDALAQTVRDLEEPAVIVVESAVSDECFLLAVARTFDATRIVTAVREGWLRFAHAGGTGQFHIHARSACGHFVLRPRVAVVIDSDRKCPLGAGNDRYVNQIRRAGVPDDAIHMWAGQEVENYVPVRVWVRHFDRDHPKHAMVAMLPRMTTAHRRYLDHKKGLRLADASDATQAFFADLPQDIRDAWNCGLENSNGKMPQPLIPKDMVLAKEDFAELGAEAVVELQNILIMINKIL
jgi:hypothetical protein